MTRIKKYLTIQLAAYLLLAAMLAYAIGVEREHSNYNRRQLAGQTRFVLVQGCERQNQLRETLRGILVATQTSTGPNDPRLMRLAATDCQKAYPIPR